MSKHKIRLSLVIFAVALTLAGCSISFGGDTGVTGGGMFLSTSKGDAWVQKALMPSLTGVPKSIAGLDMETIVMDPSDYKALYLGSIENGLFFSYDRGDSWQLATALGKVTVKAIAVDPNEKCTIYVAADNKIYKSTDCSRSWAQAYYDNDPAVLVTSIAVDGYNSNNIFIGLSRGDILKSADKGNSWQAVARLESRVQRIIFSAADSRVLFAGTKDKGLFRSKDSGYNWISLGDKLKDYENSNNFRDLAISKAEPGMIILANNYGLIVSKDNGETWAKLDLITPEKEAIINSVFIGPKDASQIFYVTNTTFYRSLDGGQNWTTKKLPTVRAGWKLLVDPENTNAIYLIAKTIKK